MAVSELQTIGILMSFSSVRGQTVVNWTTIFDTKMIYFKKVNLNGADRQRIETAIRQFAVKRNTSLDFQSSATCIRQEKYFLGLESESNLTLTRIRTPFERLLPKLIFQFSKEDFNKYKVRFSFVSIFVAFLLSVGAIDLFN